MLTMPESIPINLQTITTASLSFVFAIVTSGFIGSKVQKRIDRKNPQQVTVDTNGRTVEVNISKIDVNGYIYALALTDEEKSTLHLKCRQTISTEGLGVNETISVRNNEKARVRGDMQSLFGCSQYIKILDRNLNGKELNETEILCRNTFEGLDSLEFRINDRARTCTNEQKAAVIQDVQARFLLRRGLLRRNPPQQ